MDVAHAARRRAVATMAGLVGIVVLVDQLTKTWAEHRYAGRPPEHLFWTLQLTYTLNTGSAFSIGRGMTPVLIALSAGILVVLLAMGRSVVTTGKAIALGLVLGGALGNLADRLVRSNGGGVIDFVDFRWWPVFNVADAAICIGAALLAWISFRSDGASRADERRPSPVGR